MRLDAFLVEQGKVSSRGRAKRAIVEGHVKVDGKPVTKPSRRVGLNNSIEVSSDIDVPSGYLKLRNIQDRTPIIQPGDIVLDLGSSAGGFLLYASSIAAQVIGVEYSRDFIPRLEELAASRENIRLVRGDVFTLPLEAMSARCVDVILNDITVEPWDSISVLERVLPLLSPEGQILQVLKLSNRSNLERYLDRIQGLGLTVQQVIEPQKREVYVIAARNQSSEAEQ